MRTCWYCFGCSISRSFRWLWSSWPLVSCQWSLHINQYGWAPGEHTFAMTCSSLPPSFNLIFRIPIRRENERLLVQFRICKYWRSALRSWSSSRLTNWERNSSNRFKEAKNPHLFLGGGIGQETENCIRYFPSRQKSEWGVPYSPRPSEASHKFHGLIYLHHLRW